MTRYDSWLTCGADTEAVDCDECHGSGEICETCGLPIVEFPVRPQTCCGCDEDERKVGVCQDCEGSGQKYQ